MSDPRKNDADPRSSILQFLSAGEVASFRAEEGGACLADGDEYIDMAAPDNGVRRVHRAMQMTIGQVLPRYAVSAETWAKIRARFGARFAMNPSK